MKIYPTSSRPKRSLVKSIPGEGEGHVGDVDADLEPCAEHDEDGGEAEQRERVGDDGRRTNLRLTELMLDLGLHAGLGRRVLFRRVFNND
jgi:hypothetical protein